VALSVLLLALALGVLLAIRIAAPGLTPFSRRARPTRR
jgi:hypothetical protein